MRYQIELLTKSGPITEIYIDTQNLQEFVKQMIDKHGEFVMLSSEAI